MSAAVTSMRRVRVREKRPDPRVVANTLLNELDSCSNAECDFKLYAIDRSFLLMDTCAPKGMHQDWYAATDSFDATPHAEQNEEENGSHPTQQKRFKNGCRIKALRNLGESVRFAEDSPFWVLADGNSFLNTFGRN